MNDLIEAGFVILQLLLFILNFKWMNKRLMHPAVVFSFLWFFILFLHLVFKLSILKDLYDVSPYTLYVIFTGTAGFSLGSIIISILKEKREERFGMKQYSPPFWLETVSKRIPLILVLLVVLLSPIYVFKSYQVFLASNIDNFLIGLRTELTYGDTDLGPIKYLTSFSYFVLAVQQYNYYRRRDLRSKTYFVTSLIFALFIAVLTTGRGPILWVFSILLGINYLLGRKFSVRSVGLTVGAFIIIFAFIGVIFQKGGSLNASLSDNVRESTEVTATYLVASINALDQNLHDNTLPDYSGDHSLRFFKAVGRAFGLFRNQEVAELVQLFVFVPYPTNVYTIYNTYFSDFGVYYAFFIIALIGLVQTVIYYKAIQTRNIRYSIYFSMSLYPLLMSFFQDMYLSLISTWVQIIIFTEFFILLNRFSLEHGD